MILPIGHQQTSVRRLPWVSFAIIGLCLLVQLGLDTDGVEELPDQSRDAYLQEASDYWREHAYLEADPEVLGEVGYDVMPNQRSQYLEVLRERASDWAPRDPDELVAEQTELDRLTDLATGRLVPELVEENNPYARWGVTPASPRAHTWLTHIFVHAGWLHLLGNLFLFFLAAPPVEDRYGRPLFAGFFLTAGLFAAGMHAALTQDPGIPMVGASGAISGMLGAFLVLFWSTKIRFFYFFFIGFRFLTGTFEAAAYLMLPLWFGNELFQAWLSHSMGVSGGVAYWAHIGGFLAGAGGALLIRQLRIEERFIHPAIESKVTFATGNPAVEEALELRQSGEHAEAFSLLSETLAATPDDPDVVLCLWDVAIACQRAEEAAPAFGGLIRQLAQAGELESAAAHWTELTNLVPDAIVDAGALMRIWPVVKEREPQEKWIQVLRHAVDSRQSALTPGLAMRVLELARELDPPTALRAAERVLEGDALHEAKRAKIEALVAELEAAGVEKAPDAAAERVEHQAQAASAFADDGSIELEPGWDADDLSQDPRHGAPVSQVLAAAVVAPGRALSLDGDLEADPSASEVSPPPLPQPEPPPLPGETSPSPPGAAPPPLPEVDLQSTDPQLDEDLAIAIALPRFSGLKLVDATPVRFEESSLVLRTSAGRKARIEFDRIEALAVGAIAELGPRPVVVVDLVLNWTDLSEGTLRIVRMRSDRFDPRALVESPEGEGALAAFRALLAQLLEVSDAVALPDPESGRGMPFRRFEGLAEYQREVLQVDS